MKRPLVKPVNVHGMGGLKKKKRKQQPYLLAPSSQDFQEDQMTKVLLCSDFTKRDLSPLFFIQNLK